jgi:protein ImuA
MVPLSTLSEPCDNPALAPRVARLGLEEAWGEGASGRVAATLFGLVRAAEGDGRPVVMVAPTAWLREQGRWFRDGLKIAGLADDRLLFVETARDVQTLWALEECLKSDAVAGAVAAVDAVSLLASRRLDMVARQAKATCLLLRTQPAKDISAARRRWSIAPAPSAPHPYDEEAPGAARIAVRLTRSRGEPPGDWILEWDDETHRFRLASGLADHGLVPDGRAAAVG